MKIQAGVLVRGVWKEKKKKWVLAAADSDNQWEQISDAACHGQQLICPRAFLYKRPEWTGLNKCWVTTEYWADMCYLHWWWTIAVINSRSVPPQWAKSDYTGSICMCLHTHTNTRVCVREKKTGIKKSTIDLRNVWERWRRYSHIVELPSGILCTQAEERRHVCLGLVSSPVCPAPHKKREKW